MDSLMFVTMVIASHVVAAVLAVFVVIKEKRADKKEFEMFVERLLAENAKCERTHEPVYNVVNTLPPPLPVVQVAQPAVADKKKKKTRKK